MVVSNRIMDAWNKFDLNVENNGSFNSHDHDYRRLILANGHLFYA